MRGATETKSGACNCSVMARLSRWLRLKAALLQDASAASLFDWQWLLSPYSKAHAAANADANATSTPPMDHGTPARRTTLKACFPFF